jgi:integrase/recombinase XerD
MKLSTDIRQFFIQYLPNIKGDSVNTQKAYRDTFRLFLPFAAHYHKIKIESLTVDHLAMDMIVAFLGSLENDRNNIARTRNQRLACLKSFAKMIRLLHTEKRDVAERILAIPQKKEQKKLIGFLYHSQVMKVFDTVDLKKKDGFRDYTILNILYDTGVRASEVASLSIDYFDPINMTLAVLGKGNRFRKIELLQRNAQLLRSYIEKYRIEPIPQFRKRIFINQRKRELTRHGIHRICKKYLTLALSEKERRFINPVHSFRHSCAVNMLNAGYSVTDIKNRLGHQNIDSTMIYLQLDMSKRKEIQDQFMEYTKIVFSKDPTIQDLIGWDDDSEKILKWLDSL